jgi:hypothetical protein
MSYPVEKRPRYPLYRKALWVPEPAWTLWKKEFLLHTGNCAALPAPSSEYTDDSVKREVFSLATMAVANIIHTVSVVDE